MQKEIWISSHITKKKGLGYLIACIDSLTPISSNVNIIISYSGLMIDLPEHIIKYQHNDRMSQFDHIRYIFEQRKGLLNENDLILFLDDDDMVLPKSDVEYKGYITDRNGSVNSFTYKFESPFETISDGIPGVVGQQILGRSSDKDKFSFSHIFIEEVHNFCFSGFRELVEDFSGTIIRKQYLEKFLSQKNTSNITLIPGFEKFMQFADKYIENTTDTRLMDFIDNLHSSNCYRNPTVFHRIKEYQSEWM